MGELRIRPLDWGTLSTERSTLTYMRNFGVKMDIPCLVWVIEGGDAGPVIVDTGPPEPGWSTKYHFPMKPRAPHQEPAESLRRAGVDPAAVRTVVLTHLHWDHAFNNGLFPNAAFYVQKSELEYAIAPLPVHARGYEAVTIGMRPDYFTHTKLTLLDGDAQIAPGISVVPTPGHSAGIQTVVVETGAGRYLLATDTIPLYENWESGNPAIPHLPNTIHVGLVEYFESFKILERLGGIVLPGHDPDVLTREVYP